jgi:hypothetical protein
VGAPAITAATGLVESPQLRAKGPSSLDRRGAFVRLAGSVRYRASLTATRTGPSPAGGDELMLDQLPNQHLQLWAHLEMDDQQKRRLAGRVASGA